MVEGGRAEGGQAPANLRRERRGEGAPRPTRPLGVPASRSPFFFSPPLSPSLQALSVPGDDRGGRHGRHRAHPLCRLFHADRRQLCRVAVGVRERGGGAAARGSRVRGGGGSRKDGRPLAAVYKTPALSTCTRPPPSLVLHSILSCALENSKHRGREERDGVVGCKNTDRRKNERKKKNWREDGQRKGEDERRLRAFCFGDPASLSLSLPPWCGIRIRIQSVRSVAGAPSKGAPRARNRFSCFSSSRAHRFERERDGGGGLAFCVAAAAREGPLFSPPARLALVIARSVQGRTLNYLQGESRHRAGPGRRPPGPH